MFQGPQLKLDDLIIKRKDLIIRLIDDRAVLLNPEYCHPFRLNAVGTKIWELIDSCQKVKDLVDAVTELYEANREEVVQDIKNFLSELLKSELIKTG
jgi:hypothetical protein